MFVEIRMQVRYVKDLDAAKISLNTQETPANNENYNKYGVPVGIGLLA